MFTDLGQGRHHFLVIDRQQNTENMSQKITLNKNAKKKKKCFWGQINIKCKILAIENSCY